MRILIYSESFSPELISTGKYTGEMAEWLARRGHEIRVVTTPPHYPEWKIFEGYSAYFYKKERWHLQSVLNGSLEVIRCPVWLPRQPRGWRRVLYLMSFAVSSLPLALFQSLWRPDVILLVEPSFICSPAALCLARWSGGVAWLHVQDFELDVAFQLRDFPSGLFRRSMELLERHLRRKFDRVSTISDRMVERLATKGIASERRVLFPNWVDTFQIYPLSHPSPLRQELGIDERTVVALFSGSMGLKHGLQLLADASCKLAFRSDIRFVFCGDGPHRELFVELAKTSDNVTVIQLQPTERLNDLLNLADIHLLPQLPNAADLVMPSKLTGMMASGKPIIATANPGTQLADVLKGKGIVTTPEDLNDFVTAITRLADDPRLRFRMGEEARTYAVDKMEREEILRRFESSLLSSLRRTGTRIKNRLVTNEKEKSPAI